MLFLYSPWLDRFRSVSQLSFFLGSCMYQQSQSATHQKVSILFFYTLQWLRLTYFVKIMFFDLLIELIRANLSIKKNLILYSFADT